MNNFFSKMVLIFVVVCMSNINFAFAIKKVSLNGKMSLEKVGDLLQMVNPVVGVYVASQEKGVGHFAVIYGEALVIMGAGQFIGEKTKWSVSKRPYAGPGKRERFNGFPSGHTTSAWTSASYVRVFSEDYKMLAVPLYASAIITGYSRIKAKKHIATQVIAAAVLSEAVTIINSKLDWSNNYRTTSFNFGPEGGSLSFTFNF